MRVGERKRVCWLDCIGKYRMYYDGYRWHWWWDNFGYWIGDEFITYHCDVKFFSENANERKQLELFCTE